MRHTYLEISSITSYLIGNIGEQSLAFYYSYFLTFYCVDMRKKNSLHYYPWQFLESLNNKIYIKVDFDKMMIKRSFDFTLSVCEKIVLII